MASKLLAQGLDNLLSAFMIVVQEKIHLVFQAEQCARKSDKITVTAHTAKN